MYDEECDFSFHVEVFHINLTNTLACALRRALNIDALARRAAQLSALQIVACTVGDGRAIDVENARMFQTDGTSTEGIDDGA